MQPCRGQSKTGSIHIFIEHALPSALPLELPELLPPKMFAVREDEPTRRGRGGTRRTTTKCPCRPEPWRRPPGGVPLSSPGAHAAPQAPLLLLGKPPELDDPLLPLEPWTLRSHSSRRNHRP